MISTPGSLDVISNGKGLAISPDPCTCREVECLDASGFCYHHCARLGIRFAIQAADAMITGFPLDEVDLSAIYSSDDATDRTYSRR